MYPSHKNSYLQVATPTVDPRIINRCVAKAMEEPIIDPFDKISPFNRLASNQPCIPIPNCDVTRRPLGFGRWALPKLYKELSSSNVEVVRQAVTTLCDIMHDPEKNYEAIQLGFPAKMAELLIYDEPTVRERTLIALTTIGNLLEGKFAIIQDVTMLQNIMLCMKDNEAPVRMQVFCLLEAVSVVWMAADGFVDNGFVEYIIEILRETYRIEEKVVLVLMFKSLEHLMYCNGKYIGINNGLYEVCLCVIVNETNEHVIGAVLKCISILLQTEEGQQLAMETKLVKRFLYKYVLSEIEVIYENALAALVFTTLKRYAIAKAVKLPKLLDRLVTLSKSTHQRTTQKLAMQVLTNLSAHGLVKKYVFGERFEELEAVDVKDDALAARVKELLLVDSLKYG